MKKIIASLTLVGLGVMVLGPALIAANGETVTTGLDRGTGGGEIPIVKVKWEANRDRYTDDDMLTPDAQFDAPGVWGTNMEYTVCAIATDPNGVADLTGVYADIFYPTDRVMHKSGENPDNPTGGCGLMIEENTLTPLTKTEGYELFCNLLRTNNPGLPTFNFPYTWDEICAVDGELMKETAYVYCDDKTLTWEDPAGDYGVQVFAQDQAGNNSYTLENSFEYLPLTGFEKDFSNVDYGQVLLNTHKKVAGNTIWDDGIATIRNIGNTRLNMQVAQDDMGLGKTSGVWNVKYDARVGNNEANWLVYDPFKYKGGPEDPVYTTPLEETLDLSEVEEMDFSILVSKWPDSNTSYSGTTWLNAVEGKLLTCTEP